VKGEVKSREFTSQDLQKMQEKKGAARNVAPSDRTNFSYTTVYEKVKRASTGKEI